VQSNKIHIGIIEDCAKVGGAQVNIFLLAKNLSPRFKLTVFCPQKGELTDELKARRIPSIVVPMDRLVSTSTRIGKRYLFNPLAVIYNLSLILPYSVKLARVMREHRVDVVHTNSMFAHIIGGIAARLSGLPCIWHMQDIVSPRLLWGLIRKTVKLMAPSLATRVVVVSKAVSEMFAGNGKTPTLIVPNGMEIDFSHRDGRGKLRSELGLPSHVKLVGLVGRLTPWKGQRTFLMAAEAVVRERTDVHFLMIGAASEEEKYFERELRRWVQRPFLRNKVTILGFRQDVWKLIPDFDIGVIASEDPDPLPRIVLEFMASGVPVIATAVGGIPEMVRDGVEGKLIPPKNPRHMADVILEMVDQRSLRRKMGENGKEKVREKFSAHQFIQAFEELYESVICPQ